MAIVRALAEYGLDISVNGNGTTDPAPGSYTYAEGTIVAITAIPDAGWKLDHWEMDGTYAGTSTTINVTMDSYHAIVAYFVLETYTLTIDATIGGTTDPAPGSYSYHYGDVATITAIPDSGYYFSVWLVDGITYSDNPLSLTITGNLTATASFEELAKATLTGTISDANTGDPITGATVTLDSASTTSDSTGKYSLTVTVGIYTLRISANGYQTWSETVDLSAGGTQTLDVKLTPLPPPPPSQSIVQGTVTDSKTGNPIPDASININGYSITSDENGNFSIAVAPSTYTVTVTKEGYEDWSQSLDATTPATYVVNVSLTEKVVTAQVSWVPIVLIIIVGIAFFAFKRE